MAEKELALIAGEIARAHPGVTLDIRHRIGSLAVGDVAVAVAAASPHRAAAFAACRAGIEAIKARVPIWKRSSAPDAELLGERRTCEEKRHKPDPGISDLPQTH